MDHSPLDWARTNPSFIKVWSGHTLGVEGREREDMLVPNCHTTTIVQLVGTRGENDDLYIMSVDKTDGNQEKPPAAGFAENLAPECG